MSQSDSPSERRRDGDGRVWQLLRGPFLDYRETMVVQATLGWEQSGQVRTDLHIPLAEWQAWVLADDPLGK